MPDAYSFRSGDDFDGDHIANRDEYVLGLNPTPEARGFYRYRARLLPVRSP
jgi:hypothetical protein